MQQDDKDNINEDLLPLLSLLARFTRTCALHQGAEEGYQIILTCFFHFSKDNYLEDFGVVENIRLDIIQASFLKAHFDTFLPLKFAPRIYKLGLFSIFMLRATTFSLKQGFYKNKHQLFSVYVSAIELILNVVYIVEVNSWVLYPMQSKQQW